MPLEAYYHECCCCHRRDWVMARTARQASKRLHAMAPVCGCVGTWCLMCNRCRVHCTHGCPICGKTGRAHWLAIGNGLSYPVCPEHEEELLARLGDVRMDA
jgi:hypothetical protein